MTKIYCTKIQYIFEINVKNFNIKNQEFFKVIPRVDSSTSKVNSVEHNSYSERATSPPSLPSLLSTLCWSPWPWVSHCLLKEALHSISSQKRKEPGKVFSNRCLDASPRGPLGFQPIIADQESRFLSNVFREF